MRRKSYQDEVNPNDEDLHIKRGIANLVRRVQTAKVKGRSRVREEKEGREEKGTKGFGVKS